MNGSTNYEVPGGYTFPLTWRYTLSGTFLSALGLMGFMTGPHKILSYEAELVNVTTTDGEMTLNPIGTESGIVYLSFSVLIITEDSNET